MSGPTIGDPSSMTPQFYDGETVSLASTDWTPTVSGKSFARGVLVGGAGSGHLKVDFLGTSGSGGQTGITITGVLAGQLLQIAVTKIYKTGTDVTNITALY